MNLPEPIEWINKRLRDEYGFHDLARPNWRVVWSEDQFEKRLGVFTDYTPEGIFIREVTEVREVPKYRQWIQEKWVLERLTVVPIPNITELLGEQLSYEPMWVFEDGNGRPLPPIFRASKLIIETVLKNMERGIQRYKDPLSNPKEAAEIQRARLDQTEKELFGNETTVGDALAQDHAVGYGIRKRSDG